MHTHIWKIYEQKKNCTIIPLEDDTMITQDSAIAEITRLQRVINKNAIKIFCSDQFDTGSLQI